MNTEKKKWGPHMRQPATPFRKPGTPAWKAGVALLRLGCRISAARAGGVALSELLGRSRRTFLALWGAVDAYHPGMPPAGAIGVQICSKQICLFALFLLREQEKEGRSPVREPAN